MIKKISKESHTVVWAAVTPRDGMEAEQLSSSPLASHFTVVSCDGGLSRCQYSTPASNERNVDEW